MQYFFKLDFIENNCTKAWRAIGWCSFVNGRYEQAMKHYEKILAFKPLAADYLNAGHVAWTQKNMQKAVEYYRKSVISYGDATTFIEWFDKDKPLLIHHGISEEDIPLMLDLVIS